MRFAAMAAMAAAVAVGWLGIGEDTARAAVFDGQTRGLRVALGAGPGAVVWQLDGDATAATPVVVGAFELGAGVSDRVTLGYATRLGFFVRDGLVTQSEVGGLVASWASDRWFVEGGGGYAMYTDPGKGGVGLRLGPGLLAGGGLSLARNVELAVDVGVGLPRGVVAADAYGMIRFVAR